MAQDTQTMRRNELTKLKTNRFIRDGYSFLGWNTDPNAKEADYDDGKNYSFSGPTTLYAIWNLLSWNISYNMNGHGSQPASALTQYTSDVLPYVPPIPTNPPGYLFDYWTPYFIDEGETGNKTFTANWREYVETDPGYLTVFLLDVSGSMFIHENAGKLQYNFEDFGKAITTILLMQKNYLNLNTDYARVKIYSGTEVSNIKSTTTIQELDVSQSEYPGNLEFWKRIQPHVFGQAGGGGDEWMLACSYYMIDDTFRNTLLSSNFKIGSSNLKGITFVVLTDEILIGQTSIDTDGYNTIMKECPWFSAWQNNVADSMKFPSKKNELDSDAERQLVAQKITKVFKYISHYYGVNLVFGMSGLLAHSWERKTIIKNRIFPSVNSKCMNEYGEYLHESGSSDEIDRASLTPSFEWKTTKKGAASYTPTTFELVENVQGQEATTWTLPPGVTQPYSEMAKITYVNATFKDEKTMKPSDLYLDMNSSDNLTTKIHLVDGQYFQFRFPEESLTLPTQADLSASETRTLTGWKNLSTQETHQPGEILESNFVEYKDDTEITYKWSGKTYNAQEQQTYYIWRNPNDSTNRISYSPERTIPWFLVKRDPTNPQSTYSLTCHDASVDANFMVFSNTDKNEVVYISRTNLLQDMVFSAVYS